MSDRRARRAGVPRRALAIVAGLCAVALAACGNALQDQPVPHNTLESLMMAPYPVYWLGRSFQGAAITEAAHDPSGAFSVQYGDCTEGGQGTCVHPVRVVTSPDNSFLPAGSGSRRTAHIRGVAAVVARGGQTIQIPTAGVVVGIYAVNAALAGAAVEAIVPINGPGAPGARLPARLRDTRYSNTPLPAQTPSRLRALG